MKILHSADWHLDSPFRDKSEAQARFLRAELLKIPEMIADICTREGCDLVLLAGDLFDGACSAESLRAVKSALAQMKVPVCIAPGNHDYCAPNSPYLAEIWPENVHIFTRPVMERFQIPHLNCSVWGAGYQAMDCPGLLDGFQAPDDGQIHIGLIHSDPLQASSPYAPLTTRQVEASGLHYLALGHIHKEGHFLAGKTLCAWPGCPMGRGFDETGTKGVLTVRIDDGVTASIYPLNLPKFFDEAIDAGVDALQSLHAMLPPVATSDFYRVTLTGYASDIHTAALEGAFPHVPNLIVRDRTIPEVDLWSDLEADTLEGTYFRMLHQKLDNAGENLQQQILLAARISRQILDGQEVILP